MQEPNSIDYSNWTGLKFLIAKMCDKDHNGKLEKTAKYDEISIFNQQYAETHAKSDDYFTVKTDAIHDYKADAEIARLQEKELNKMNPEVNNFPSKIFNNINKIALSKKMYNKWHSKFPNSPLKQDFYEKVYDIIETLNIKVPEEQWDKKSYSSPQEQAMDQVIAVFAGESRLNPKSKNGIYNGLFQLAKPGLTESKNWAAKNKNVKGMNNINKNLSIEGFRNLSGAKQLDYLVAYIGKCKEYSKIGSDESITPAQLWAMIKMPFDGRKSKSITAKTNAINNVFENNKIHKGTIS